MNLITSTLNAQAQASSAATALNLKYDDYYLYLIDFLREKNAFHRNISFPLLIKPFPEYFESTTKLMIFGKETFSWPIGEGLPCLRDGILNQTIVESLLRKYENFKLGKGRQSPFWQFCRKLNHKFNKSDKAFIWNNISKVDENKTTPKWDILKGLSATNCSSIINDEVAILKPDVVVFVTGSIPESHLNNVFKGMELIVINDVLFRVKHPLLPYHSYKTQHPKNLRLKGKFDDVINFIHSEVTKGVEANVDSLFINT
ncbi:hypothetical protein [Mucilaginibacter lappiensis]|uniref:hypothetical protein n=1 Tax=Mucilaginibacter lappiensis TaxID=354630 RepID=UPI003D19F1DD